MKYIWSGAFSESPLTAVNNSNKLSIVCDVSFDAKLKIYVFDLDFVRVQKADSDKFLVIPAGFVEDFFSVDKKELSVFLFDQHRRQKMDVAAATH